MIFRIFSLLLCGSSFALATPFDTEGEQTEYSTTGGSVDNRIKFTYKFLSVGKNNDGFMCGNLLVEKDYAKTGKKEKDVYYWCVKEPGKLLVLSTDVDKPGSEVRERTMPYEFKGDRLSFAKFDLLSPTMLLPGESKVRPAGELAPVKEKNHYVRFTQTNRLANEARAKLPWYTPGKSVQYDGIGVQALDGKGELELVVRFVAVGTDKEGRMCGEGVQYARYKADGKVMFDEPFQWRLDEKTEEGEGKDVEVTSLVFSIASQKSFKKAYVEGNVNYSKMLVEPQENFVELVDGDENYIHNIQQYKASDITEAPGFAEKKKEMAEANCFLNDLKAEK